VLVVDLREPRELLRPGERQVEAQRAAAELVVARRVLAPALGIRAPRVVAVLVAGERAGRPSAAPHAVHVEAQRGAAGEGAAEGRVEPLAIALGVVAVAVAARVRDRGEGVGGPARDRA